MRRHLLGSGSGAGESTSTGGYLGPEGRGAFSFVCLYRPDMGIGGNPGWTVDFGSSIANVMFAQASGGAEAGIFLWDQGNSGNIEVGFFLTDGAGNDAEVYSQDLTAAWLGSEHRIACIYTGGTGAGSMRIFIDGVEATLTNGFGPPSTALVMTGFDGPMDLIGTSTARIGDVLVMNRALTTSEAQAATSLASPTYAGLGTTDWVYGRPLVSAGNAELVDGDNLLTIAGGDFVTYSPRAAYPGAAPSPQDVTVALTELVTPQAVSVANAAAAAQAVSVAVTELVAAQAASVIQGAGAAQAVSVAVTELVTPQAASVANATAPTQSVTAAVTEAVAPAAVSVDQSSAAGGTITAALTELVTPQAASVTQGAATAQSVTAALTETVAPAAVSVDQSTAAGGTITAALTELVAPQAASVTQGAAVAQEVTAALTEVLAVRPAGVFIGAPFVVARYVDVYHRPELELVERAELELRDDR